MQMKPVLFHKIQIAGLLIFGFNEFPAVMVETVLIIPADEVRERLAYQLSFIHP
jgi:hypothetical protein